MARKARFEAIDHRAEIGMGVVENRAPFVRIDLRVQARMQARQAVGVAGGQVELMGELVDHHRAGAVLETGCVYIAELQESLALPADLAAAANPKSSTGRIDVFTRVITDRGEAFDQVEPGYDGPLYAEISPRTFPVLVRSGSRLSQIRFRRGAPRLTEVELGLLHARSALVDAGSPSFQGGVAVSVDLGAGSAASTVWTCDLSAEYVKINAEYRT